MTAPSPHTGASAGVKRPAPVFIGGSPRSGTHVVGRLLARHPAYCLVPTEARFHAARGGLPDLLAGRTTLEAFLARCRGDWWRRPGLRRDRGLYLVIERETLEAELARFQAHFDSDPWGASRGLAANVLGAAAPRGQRSFVEATGSNVASAPTLSRLFPGARFLNMVRDGRAVAAGMLNNREMTDDPLRALAIWSRRVRSAHAAAGSMPRESMLTLELERLVARDRACSYARLVEFLEVGDDESMRGFFDERISAAAAHFGRWRERVSPQVAGQIDQRHGELLEALGREGIPWVAALEEDRLSA